MKFLDIILFVSCIALIPSVGLAQVSNVSHPDNLKATHRLGCLSIDELSPKYSPADYAGALIACAKRKQIENAATAFFMINIYGSYDGQQVKDRTAHQGIQVLMIEALNQTSNKTGQDIRAFASRAVQEKGPFFKALCERVKSMGRPTYKPVYLAAHGMGAFVTRNGKVQGKGRSTLIAELSKSDLGGKWAKTLKPCSSVLK